MDQWTGCWVWVRAHTHVGPGPKSPAALSRTLEDDMLTMTQSSPVQVVYYSILISFELI